MTNSTHNQLSKHVLVPWSVQGSNNRTEIVRGDGSYLFDAQDKKILDFSSGWVATNLGHNNRTVIDAIKAQLDKLCWGPPSLDNDTRTEYAARLSDLSPWDEGCRTHFVTGGGEANDDAVKIARLLTGRTKIMAAYRSYHGCTQGTSALTGGKRRWAAEPTTPGGVVRFWAPFPYRSPFYTTDPSDELERGLDHVRRVIAQENPERIAALIIEPVVGSDGLVVYPDGYLAGLREICDQFGIVLIFDEVMTGFGRVGEAFAALRFGVTPDIITFAKASSAAYIPLGGVMVRESLGCQFDTKLFDAGHTHAGHPVAMAAGLGALKAFEAGNLFKKAYEIEKWVEEAFANLVEQHPAIGDIRGRGAFFGLELVRDRETKEPISEWQSKDNGDMQYFFDGLRKRGLLLHGKNSISVIAPPLTVSKKEFDDGISIIGDTLAEFESKIGI